MGRVNAGKPRHWLIYSQDTPRRRWDLPAETSRNKGKFYPAGWPQVSAPVPQTDRRTARRFDDRGRPQARAWGAFGMLARRRDSRYAVTASQCPARA